MTNLRHVLLGLDGKDEFLRLSLLQSALPRTTDKVEGVAPDEAFVGCSSSLSDLPGSCVRVIPS
jgi:hypothetical protein